jgi:proliferating cell nuclear antigen
MLKATISTKLLMLIVDALNSLTSETRFVYNQNGISADGVDAANCALCKISISKDAFESYEAEDGEIGLDLVKLKEMKQFLTKYNKVELEIKKGSNVIELNFGAYKSKIVTINTSTIKKVPEPPNLNAIGEAIVQGSVLNESIKAATLVHSMLYIVIEENAFYIYAEDLSNEIRRDFSEEEILMCNYEPCKSLYSIDYLIDMGKIMKDYEIGIKFGNDFPIIFDFDIFDKNGHITYLLAPRILNK